MRCDSQRVTGTWVAKILSLRILPKVNLPWIGEVVHHPKTWGSPGSRARFGISLVIHLCICPCGMLWDKDLTAKECLRLKGWVCESWGSFVTVWKVQNGSSSCYEHAEHAASSQRSRIHTPQNKNGKPYRALQQSPKSLWKFCLGVPVTVYMYLR